LVDLLDTLINKIEGFSNIVDLICKKIIQMCKSSDFYELFISEISNRDRSLHKNPAILRILKSRLHYYQQRIEDLNNKSWKIPNARFPNNPKIEEFLKSEQQSMKYYGFSNKFDVSCFLKDNKDSLDTYSLSYISEGKSTNACVKIAKSEDYQKAQESHKILFETKMDWLQKLIS
jgi:hypothetical protein